MEVILTYYSNINENDVDIRREKFGDKPGIYILRSKIDGNITPVPRFSTVDVDGILYIGMSSTVRGGRVSELKKSLSLKYPTDGHSAGVRYRSNTKVIERYPYDSLYLELIATDTTEDAGKLEGQLLGEYLTKFGELPPLNRSA